MDLDNFIIYIDYLIKKVVEVLNQILKRLGMDPLGSTTEPETTTEAETTTVAG